MRRTRATKRTSPLVQNNKHETKKKRGIRNTASDSSSSESDIENYLKSAKDIDLNSSFFQVSLSERNNFEQIEKDIFSGINRLSESDSDSYVDNLGKEFNLEQESAETTKSIGSVINFENIHVYNKKLEDAKKHIENYKAKKKLEENKLDVSNILAIGESKTIDDASPAYSSDFETFSDSEKDWEEVHNVEERPLVSSKGVEITVELPGHMRKRKGVDLMAAVRRRINRIKKENQIYVHKVHLLCWIAHGNYVNNILSNENVMGLALSLLPSQQCYPSDRLTISYLEEILQWYKKTVKNEENKQNTNGELSEMIEEQIIKKVTTDNRMFVFIFISILRSLGIKCRLILSLQVEPLRPPMVELSSASSNISKSSNKTPSTSKDISHNKYTPARSTKKKNLPAVVSTKKLNHSSKLNPKSKHVKTLKRIDFDSERENTKDSSNVNSKLNKQKEIKSKSSHAVRVKDPTSKRESTKTSEKKDIKIPPKSSKKSKVTKYSANLAKEINSEEACQNRKVATKNSDTKKLQKIEDGLEFKQLNRNQDGDLSKKINSNLRRSTRQQTTIQKTENILPMQKVKNMSENTLPSPISVDSDVTINKSKNKSSPYIKSEKSPLPLKDKKINEKTECMSSCKSLVQTNLSEITSNKSSKYVRNKPKNLKKSANAKNPSAQLKVKMPFTLKPETHKGNDIDKNKQFDDTSTKTIEVPIIKKGLNRNRFEGQDIPQLDGGNDDDSDAILANAKIKPNLGKLKTPKNKCSENEHPKRLKKVVHYKDIDSDEDFLPKSSLIKGISALPRKTNSETGFNSTSQKTNLNKLKTHSQKLRFQSSENDKRRCFVSSAKSKKGDVKNDIMTLVMQSLVEEENSKRSKLVKHKRVSRTYSSDSDYMPSMKKKVQLDDFKEKNVKVKRRIPTKKDIIALEDKKQAEKEDAKKKKAINVWAEVYAEAEEKWISVDVIKGQIHCVKELSTRATHPISYILSWDNDGFIKDVTKRYCTNWNTVTRKLRVDSKWWQQTLLPYKSPTNPREREEDEDLARQELEQPLPTTISEYKNHPLYVLKRHLLKFEAIYPSDALTLGFIRNEPVYSRDCVHVLHSREIWLKHAKVVKLGEIPYKIVKARPKYDKLSNTVITDKPLEIFGKWQVEDYVPPTAENGIVPRNAYGNVELFKSCMLPKGTVHLQLPGLNKVARKMNIDCAPAVVGFDFHGGWSHPTFDGFVVCEEFSEQLVAAWFVEQEESEKRAQEKVEKRVYENWRRLIRGLLIRERLKAKYDFGEPSTSKDAKGKKKGVSLSIKKGKIQ